MRLHVYLYLYYNVPYPGPNRVNFNDVPLVSIGAAKVDLSFDNVEAHVMLYLTNKVVPYKINLTITCKILSYKRLTEPYM